MTTYSTESDLMFKIGDVPLPSYINISTVLQGAADEIDSYIGFRYVTPLNMAESGENMMARPARLLIKRISASLSTGRLILAVAASGEQTELHSYGQSLVREALASLAMIASGEVPLDGAVLLPLEEAGGPTGPLIYNEDDVSQVETFYEAMRPSSLGYFPYRARPPYGTF